MALDSTYLYTLQLIEGSVVVLDFSQTRPKASGRGPKLFIVPRGSPRNIAPHSRRLLRYPPAATHLAGFESETQRKRIDAEAPPETLPRPHPRHRPLLLPNHRPSSSARHCPSDTSVSNNSAMRLVRARLKPRATCSAVVGDPPQEGGLRHSTPPFPSSTWEYSPDSLQ